jgi:predicted dehydrogenase/threonine dehydrogenase-like Zn-dependent dehydrogenase
MKQVFIRNGKAATEDVPAPMVEPGTVLVAVRYSCISTGTELSGLRNSAEALLTRALKHPAEVRQVLAMAANQGARRIYTMVKNKVSSGMVVGYSAAGTVIDIGEGIDDVRVGDRVACAGAQCAHHAEVIRVPRNLLVHVPEGVDLASASTATLGAIAMQGVRRCHVTLGETVVVVGLGVVGLLTVQLLRANGARVLGTDLNRERVSRALAFGARAAFHPDDENAVDHVHRLTGGYGADAVIVTAATASDSVISDAFRMCRKKGRVVLVGDVGLNLRREDLYKHEIDFLISSSYGPGRYDATYEEGGIDYPLPYVRWTENRNMGEYLALIAEGRVSVAPMVTRTEPIDAAGAAYQALEQDPSNLVALLEYAERPLADLTSRTLSMPSHTATHGGAVRIGVCGAGSFAKGMHLPNIANMRGLFSVRSIMSRTGHNAMSVAKQFDAAIATTSLDEQLADAELDAVLIASRHDEHAATVLAALAAGKHVYVEKPLALTDAELTSIEAFFEATPAARVLQTGFNRRFSKHLAKIAAIVAPRSNPMIIDYRMNAGYIPLDNWIHGPQGGGRNLGEACHVYDLFTFLTGARVARVDAQPITPRTGAYSPRDNFVATMSFADGSVASLTYTALGAKEHPKEEMEIFVDGKVIVLSDYRRVTVAGARDAGTSSRLIEKGHREAIEAFGRAIKDGMESPIPLWQQIQATRIALDVERQLAGADVSP